MQYLIKVKIGDFEFQSKENSPVVLVNVTPIENDKPHKSHHKKKEASPETPAIAETQKGQEISKPKKSHHKKKEASPETPETKNEEKKEGN